MSGPKTAVFLLSYQYEMDYLIIDQLLISIIRFHFIKRNKSPKFVINTMLHTYSDKLFSYNFGF